MHALSSNPAIKETSMKRKILWAFLIIWLILTAYLLFLSNKWASAATPPRPAPQTPPPLPPTTPPPPTPPGRPAGGTHSPPPPPRPGHPPRRVQRRPQPPRCTHYANQRAPRYSVFQRRMYDADLLLWGFRVKTEFTILKASTETIYSKQESRKKLLQILKRYCRHTVIS